MGRDRKQTKRVDTVHQKNHRGNCEPPRDHSDIRFSGVDQVPLSDDAETETSALSESSEALQAIVSSCGASEEHASVTACSSLLRCGDCRELAHELSNVMTAVIVNAQLLDWRLPPYSRLKRPVHEMERNAQRARELLRSLQRRMGESKVL